MKENLESDDVKILRIVSRFYIDPTAQTCNSGKKKLPF